MSESEYTVESSVSASSPEPIEPLSEPCCLHCSKLLHLLRRPCNASEGGMCRRCTKDRTQCKPVPPRLNPALNRLLRYRRRLREEDCPPHMDTNFERKVRKWTQKVKMYTHVRRLGGLSAKPKDQLVVYLLILKELAKIRETLKDVVALLVLQRVGGE